MTITTDTLVPYKQTPTWSSTDIPDTLLHRHNTKVGTWGKITVLSGQLKFYALTEDDVIIDEFVIDTNQDSPFVEPQAWHKIEALTDDLTFYLEFYCQPQDYLAKKYDINPHSEIKEAVEHGYITAGDTLDLGAGHGRNTLYLASLGHTVTALDQNPLGLEQIKSIADLEHYPVQTNLYDINQAQLPEEQAFDFILSTVVFMFLDPDCIPHIIYNMQEHTNIGGYNLIVCAMDTAEHPCHMPFSFTFSEGELENYYTDWEIVKYNENVGHLHRVDQFGNPIALQFATLLAKKIKD